MSKTQYADIAFPTAVRQTFTYKIPDGSSAEPGMRAWVPLRKEKVIGMVVRVHNEHPKFKTRELLEILDDQPVLTPELLKLTNWIHQFYYCSWGEAIHTALPVGLNFITDKVLHLNSDFIGKLSDAQREIVYAIAAETPGYKDALKRWKDAPHSGLLKGLIEKGVVEIWETPKQKVDYKTQKQWNWADGIKPKQIDEIIRDNEGKKWIEALKLLSDLNLPALSSDLLEHELITPYALNRIQKEGLITSSEVVVETDTQPAHPFEPDEIKTLNEAQSTAFTEIRLALDNKSFSSFLLYGITGSGKTEVYIHALKHTLEQNRGAIILVPEISLTPQTVRRFYQIFGDQIAVIHSRLSDREKFEAWQHLKKGSKRIVIGPRSAVFAPVQNLGLIVVDEEHDASYKQFDPSPRYHARDVALMRAHMENGVVVMGSATPSMVALHGVKKKKHTLLQLPGRPGGELPGVEVLDMKSYRSAMRGPLTVALYNAIEEALPKQEQVIIMYNRRGFSSYLQCEECGHIPVSPECSVSLTYHKKKNILLCHYSGYSRKADERCEACGSENIHPVGAGTEQIENEIAELFPEARIARMDRDTTSGKYAHQEIYDRVMNREVDILIGTQMLAKGLDFPQVTVVGVLQAETELAFPSFRAAERMYQLISQVAGRAGRCEKPGRVYVQTWKADHPSITFAQTHNFWEFAKFEMEQRESLSYPPFSRMIVVHFKDESLAKTQKSAHRFSEVLRAETHDGAVLGPSPAPIEWINGLNHWQASIKIDPQMAAGTIERMLNKVYKRYQAEIPKGGSTVRVTVDVDAVG